MGRPGRVRQVARTPTLLHDHRVVRGHGGGLVLAGVAGDGDGTGLAGGEEYRGLAGGGDLATLVLDPDFEVDDAVDALGALADDLAMNP